MKNFIVTVLNGVILSGVLYAGLFMNMKELVNIGVFYVWFLIFKGWICILCLGIFLAVDDEKFKQTGHPENYTKKKSKFVGYIGRIFIAFNIGMLVASGWFITGGMYLITTLLLFVIYSSVKEKAERIQGVTEA